MRAPEASGRDKRGPPGDAGIAGRAPLVGAAETGAGSGRDKRGPPVRKNKGKCRAAWAFHFAIQRWKSGTGLIPGAQKKWTWSGMMT